MTAPDLAAVTRAPAVLRRLGGITIHQEKAAHAAKTSKGTRRTKLPSTNASKQVIIAMGAEPDDAMAQQLEQGGTTVHRVGDCRDVGYIDGAILDARNLVRQLESA